MTQTTTGKAKPPGNARTVSVDFATLNMKTGTYTKVGSFVYGGSNQVGTPSACEALAGVVASISLDIRIQDITNTTTIAEATAVTDTFPSIVDLGTLSNIPTGPAVWELQVRRNQGSGNQDVEASGLILVF